MKIRDGFISNSSSSSFLIIGTEDDTLIDKILKAKEMTREEIADDINFGQCDTGDMIFIGDHETICYVGTDLSEDEMDRLPLSIIKQKFTKFLKDRYNIDVSTKDIHLYHGETSS